MTTEELDQAAADWLAWADQLTAEYDAQRAAEPSCPTCGHQLAQQVAAVAPHSVDVTPDQPARMTGAQALAELEGRRHDPWLAPASTVTNREDFEHDDR